MSRKKPLERRIILHLAQNKPQTINEIAIAITRDWKTTSIAFKRLEKERVVAKTGKPKYHRGRKFPYFWLTDLGVLRALHEGAKAEMLLTTALQIYPEDEALRFLIEAYPKLAKPMQDVYYLATLNRGTINETDLIPIFAAQLRNKLTSKQSEDFVTVLEKYPALYKQTCQELERALKLLQKT